MATAAADEIDTAAEQVESLKIADKATNGPSSIEPPQESSRPPPAAAESCKDPVKADDDEDAEDESERQQRDLELQHLNDELAKEDPRQALQCMLNIHLEISLQRVS